MEQEKIFATPEEPSFTAVLKNWDFRNLDYMLQDWLVYLKIQSKMPPSGRLWKNTLPFLAIPESVVELIFLISEKLEQPPEVRYLTVELFDRFIMRHFTTLHENVFKKPGVKNFKMWSKVVSRVQNQVLLRVMSCIQLSSKFVTHYQVLSPKTIRQFLVEAGHSFTITSIIASEMRVFKTLDFKVPLSSPLVHFETLLTILIKDFEAWKGKTYEAEILEPVYGLGLQILDIAFMSHHELYSSLFCMATGEIGPIGDQRIKFLGVECDNLFLVAGVISCAADLLYHQENDLAARVLIHLSSTTGIPKKDIYGLASILKKLSLGQLL
ncbi:cyclin N-terminal domain-containing protein 1-like [Hetaerina americana]|uniref:cyclin N-terminal domain-containing protein 1-like n=1 Tax=Hetaerina americana TaxID=62018 RepID=UPI003A7F44B5